MRKIKYRQPVFLNGKFLKFHYWGTLDKGLSFIAPQTGRGEDIRKSQQCTGLKDSEEKEIYEGDILESSYTEYGHEVVFQGCSFAIKHNDKCCPPYKTSLSEASGWQEIIGNIYETPELLKG